MALQLGALRDALPEVKASEATTGKAAEELAGYDERLNRIEARLEARLVEFEAKLERRFADIEKRFGDMEKRFGDMELRFAHGDRRADGLHASITLLRWMVGFNLALTVAVLLKLLAAH